MALKTVIAAAQTVALAANLVLNTNRLVFTPKEDTNAVLNIHKGWVQQVDDAYTLKNNSSDMSTVVYVAYDWDDIEKSKGVYDWTAIDKMIAECRAVNKTFAFGILPADSSDPDTTGLVPDYVYEQGCEYVTAKANNGTELRTPVWDDKEYISASKNLIKAIAQKYDGNADIEYIDISTFGNKGNWTVDGLSGSQMPSVDVQKEMLRYWSDSFSKTQLAVSSKAAADSSSDIVYECSASGRTAADLRSDIESGRYTFVTVDSASEKALGSDFMKEMQNRIGYNFVVKYANLRYEKGDAILSVKIKNTGTASQNFSINLAAAITDERSESFAQAGGKQLVRGGTFAGGEERTFEIKFSRSDIPNKNNVFIALGAFELTDSTAPSVRFANKPENDLNYLVLGKIK